MRPNAAAHDVPLPAPSPHPIARARAVAARLRRALARPMPAPRALALQPGEVAALDVGRTPVAVRCAEGCLWVTHPAVPGDHILHAGDRLTAARPGRLVVYALKASRAVVSWGS